MGCSNCFKLGGGGADLEHSVYLQIIGHEASWYIVNEIFKWHTKGQGLATVLWQLYV